MCTLIELADAKGKITARINVTLSGGIGMGNTVRRIQTPDGDRIIVRNRGPSSDNNG